VSKIRHISIPLNKGYAGKMIERLKMEKAKSYWFRNSHVVYAVNFDGKVYALPKFEADSALRYCEKLERCKTYKDVLELYSEFESDSERPRLIPRLLKLDEELSILEDMWIDDSDGPEREWGTLSDSELIDYWLPKSFDLWDSPLFRDEEDVLILVRDFHLWTDAWIPIEVCEEAGSEDPGSGFFYSPAEKIYTDLEKFRKSFAGYGITVEVDNPDFLRILKYI
jgi:hypothetical protein